MAAVEGVTVVHADEALVVLNKPSGLLSVPGRGPEKQDCLSARVQQAFADALIVHRLDMCTSGLIVMARGPDAQRHLQRQFAQAQVGKGYVAIVQGLPAVPAMQWQCIDAPMRVDWPNRPRSIIDWQNGKPSRTHWRVLDAPQTHAALVPDFFRPQVATGQAGSERAENGYAVLEVAPETGRSHQIRVHLQAIGHPIAGDSLYGDAANQRMAPRLLLHAWRLALQHPLTGEAMAWQCPTRFD
ncbi:MAG: RluA family pseudouridine synthase [Brachymonas sp.]|nr:RluA family pseudouridine synthase [Brachymonas sp.]